MKLWYDSDKLWTLIELKFFYRVPNSLVIYFQMVLSGKLVLNKCLLIQVRGQTFVDQQYLVAVKVIRKIMVVHGP